MAAKYPEAFEGEWAWLKYVALGAAFFALDIAIEFVVALPGLVRRRRRGGS